jgi:hypothetical protein
MIGARFAKLGPLVRRDLKEEGEGEVEGEGE